MREEREILDNRSLKARIDLLGESYFREMSLAKDRIKRLEDIIDILWADKEKNINENI